MLIRKLLVIVAAIFSCAAAGQKKISREAYDSVAVQLTLATDSNSFWKNQVNELRRHCDKKTDSILMIWSENDKTKRQHDSIKNEKEFFCDHAYSNILGQLWASRNLLEQEVRSFIPGIVKADSLRDWDSLFNKEMPAYCFHLYDSARSHGVLLNIPALRKLHEVLKTRGCGWQIPQREDVEKLRTGLSVIRPMLSQAITSKRMATPHWKKPGSDLFDLDIVPLSYRRNSKDGWFGGTTAAFYCFNENDPQLKQRMLLVELDEDFPNQILISEKDLSDDHSNLGVYVRLIKKQ